MIIPTLNPPRTPKPEEGLHPDGSPGPCIECPGIEWLYRDSWRIFSLRLEACGRQASERRVKGEEDPHALARPVPGLGVLDRLRQELRQRRNSLLHTRLVDGTDGLQDRRQ